MPGYDSAVIAFARCVKISRGYLKQGFISCMPVGVQAPVAADVNIPPIYLRLSTPTVQVGIRKYMPMPSAPNGRPRRRWWPMLLAGFTSVVVAVLAGVTNVATSLLPTRWAWTHAPIMWSLAGALLMVAVGLAMAQARNSSWYAGDADCGQLAGSAASGVDAVVGTGSGSASIGQRAAAGSVLSGPFGDPPSTTQQIVAGEIPARPTAFVRRQAVADLASAWDSGVRVCVVQAVTGGPGVGKTQAAAAYARDCAAAGWPLVAWVSAETQDQLLAGLASVAVSTGVADADGDSAVSARNARRYLETFPGPALLVFDNATDVDGLSAFLPTVGAVQVVITSRDQAFTRLGATVDIGLFTQAQSVAYLNERTGLADKDEAASVAADLGYLPLALAQAATVISEHSWDYATFRQRLRGASTQKYLIRHAGDSYPRSVVDAIALAIGNAEEQDDSGLTHIIIALVAVLSADGVSRAVLSGLHSVTEVASSGSFPSAWDEALDKVLGRLVGRSIFTGSCAGQAFGMHRLVGRVVRERQEANGELLSTLAIAADLLQMLQIPDEEGWLRREAGGQLVRQINAVSAVFSGLAYADEPHCRELAEQIIDLRLWCVRQLMAAEDLSRAISLGVTVLADCERVLGPDHPDTLTTRSDLAAAYQSAGRQCEAIRLYERNVADFERVLGPDHPSTLISRSDLAEAYRWAGRLPEAIALYEHALGDFERVLGTDHPSTLTSRLHLTAAHREGWPRRAAILHERNVADYERVLGPDHPSTLSSRLYLAAAYRSAGWLREAMTLAERNVADYERVLGPGDPQSMDARLHLAETYRRTGRLHEAVALCERELADRERLLGPDHPRTLAARGNLAGAYRSAGRLRAAIKLYERHLADCQRILGLDHPDSLAYRGHLADTYQSAGRLFKTISLRRQNAAEAKTMPAAYHYRWLYREAITAYPLLFVAVIASFLFSAYTGNRDYAMTSSILVISFVLALPATCVFRRILAAREWKSFSSLVSAISTFCCTRYRPNI